jgi:hypothetical protein
MPRFTRLVLFLSTLSLLIIPMGDQARADDDPGEISGTVVAGAADTCHTPQPQTSHRRCTGGSFSSLANVSLEATRLVPDQNVAVCSGQPTGAIGFTTRETTAEGRGRIDDTHLVIPAGLGTEECRVRISGRFHRVATVAVGRLGIDVHRADGTFRHSYCAKFEATAVPVGTTGITAVTAVVEGIENGHPGFPPCDDPAPPLDGRLPGDGEDPLHHDTMISPFHIDP